MAESADPEIHQRPADGPQTAVLADAETPYMPEVSASMLDVHALHQSVRTWKDFFIHIATIVVGLLIAVGLEQTVELIHHRNEVREVRAALKEERETNRKFYTVNTSFFHWETAMLKNNLRVLTYLQQHPGTPEQKLPGVLTWSSQWEPIVESAWKNAKQTQVLALMPR